MLHPSCAVSQQSADDEATSVMDSVMTWTTCQMLQGAGERDAKDQGANVMKALFGAYLEKKPEVASALAKHVQEGSERYEKQLKFLRSLSGENRNTICFGLNDTFKKLGLTK